MKKSILSLACMLVLVACSNDQSAGNKKGDEAPVSNTSSQIIVKYNGEDATLTREHFEFVSQKKIDKVDFDFEKDPELGFFYEGVSYQFVRLSNTKVLVTFGNSEENPKKAGLFIITPEEFEEIKTDLEN